MDARRCKTLTAILLIVVSGLAVAPRIALANEELMKLQQDNGQWAQQSKDYSGARFSPLSQITPENVKNLKVAWSFSLGTLHGQQGGPLVVGDTMYVHSSYSTTESHNIFALDLSKEGAPIKWKYVAKHDPKAVRFAAFDLVHQGLQYANGKILYQTFDGMVIALDGKTGRELWKTRNANPSRGETNAGAGIVIHDKYIVGVAGAEFGVRGWVAAYDINTGKQVWKARNVGPDEELLLASDFNAANPHYGRFGEGTKSWPEEQWKVGGGTTRGYYAYDPDLHLFYYASGNPGTWNPAARKGDNKWASSIWARNPDTGEAKWAYQMTPWDNWSYKGSNEVIMTEQMIEGKKRKVLTHFDRNGFVYVLDRTDGTLLSAQPFVYVNWAKGIDLKTGRPILNEEKLTKQGVDTKNICPSVMGAKSEQPVAYSPKTNLFYVPSNNACMNYEGVLVQYTAGAPYVGASVLMFEGHEGKDRGWWGEVVAWDAARGKRVWSITEPFPVQSGPVVTASNVVFYGTMDGWFKAADARDGKLLWKHKVGSGIIGNPITYTGPDGNQYVAVYSGVGGWFGATVTLDLPSDEPTAALGAVNAAYLSGLPTATTKGGELVAFASSGYQAPAEAAPPGEKKPGISVSVFYGTDRNVTGDKAPARYYGEERGDSLQFGICKVSIPPSHETAEFESPSMGEDPDPSKHIVLRAVMPKDEQDFLRQLKQMIGRSSKRDALVFIHGFNTTFENACRRTAQISHDLRFQGAPIMYGWPSRGGMDVRDAMKNPERYATRYNADRETISWSTSNFEQFVMMVAQKTGAERVHLIAHSMGSQAMVEALKSLMHKHGRLSRPLFNQVVLAAPDIDAGVFRNLAGAVQKASERTTLYASANDGCLQLSKRYNGFPRAGEAGPSITVIKGIDTIDVSKVTPSSVSGIGVPPAARCLFDFLGDAGHLYYGENRAVLTDLRELIQYRKPPKDRFLDEHPWDGLSYWEIPR